MNNDSAILRLRLVGVLVVSLMAALVARLWFLQAVDNDELQARAVDNTYVDVIETAPRGRILDVNGKELVRNRLVNVVVVDLEELDRAKPTDSKRTEMLQHLAVTLSRNGKLTKVSELDFALNASGLRNYGKVIVSTDVPNDLFVFFGEQQGEFPGVHIEQRSLREYPYGTLAAHVLGYVGPIEPDEIKRLNARWRDNDPNAKTYLTNDVIGRNGIEAMFENDLRGIPGRRVYAVDKNQRVIRQLDSETREPVPGHDVVLSIDIDIQAVVEAELQTGLDIARNAEPEAKKKPTDPDPPPSRAPAGAAVVMNPQTGAIVAMASYPTYDPSEFIAGLSQQKFAQLNSDEAFKPLLNRTIGGEYAPGSTFKLFTAYAAMTKGPNDYPMLSDAGIGGYFFPRDDPGYYELPEDKCLEKAYQELLLQNKDKVVDRDLKKESTFTSCKFNNPDNRKHSGLDIMKALSVSSDAYFYEIAANYEFRLDFKQNTIQEASAQFGFGRATGSGLPFELSGAVPTEEWLKKQAQACKACGYRSNWVLADGVQNAVGQGLNKVTPLQLTNAYATFANGGSLLAPNIAKRVCSVDSDVVRTFDRRVLSTVELPQEIRNPLLWGLEGVVSLTGPEGDRGTAFEAFHYPSSGGVAFDLNTWKIAGKTGTAEVQGRADNAWFVAFNQDKERPYVMSVLLEESGFGGRFAAPVVAQVFERLLYSDYIEQKSIDQLSAEEKAKLAPAPVEPSRYGNVGAFKPTASTVPTTTSAAATAAAVPGSPLKPAAVATSNGAPVTTAPPATAPPAPERKVCGQ